MAAALLAGCAGKPAPAPRPAVEAAPAPPPGLVADTPLQPAEGWTDGPLTPGEWSYGDGEAHYAGFALRCDSARRLVVLSREGVAGPLRVLTSYGERALPAGAALPASDPLLDEMAFSRGRFAVAAEGVAMLVVPAWPEPGRVVEDCRG
jgi:hypothetical protein